MSDGLFKFVRKDWSLASDFAALKWDLCYVCISADLRSDYGNCNIEEYVTDLGLSVDSADLRSDYGNCNIEEYVTGLGLSVDSVDCDWIKLSLMVDAGYLKQDLVPKIVDFIREVQVLERLTLDSMDVIYKRECAGDVSFLTVFEGLIWDYLGRRAKLIVEAAGWDVYSIEKNRCDI